MSRFADLVWLRLPTSAGRLWRTAGAALGDGAYLRAWPAVAAGAPVVGALLGLLLGAFHPGPLYTYSFTIVALMVLAAGAGAGVGSFICLGFVVGDLALADRSGLPGFGFRSLAAQLTHGYVPLGMTYALLAALLVLVPLLATAFATRTRHALRGRSAWLLHGASQSVYVLVATAFTYAWAQAVPFMIRPVWSFSGQVPSTDAVQPIQSHTLGLALVAALAALARSTTTVILALRGESRLPKPAALGAPTGPGALIPVALAPVQAIFLTLLLGGLVGKIWLGVVVWLVLTAILLARLLAVPRIPIYPDLIRKVPLLLRMAACALLSYALTEIVVQPYVTQGSSSFTPMVVVVFGALVLAAFLFPGPRPPAWPWLGAPKTDSSGAPAVEPPPTPSHGIKRAHSALVLAVAILGIASPAVADNCSGLSDCSAGIKIALVVAAIALVVIAIVLLPEILAAAGIESAAVAEAAAAEAAAAEVAAAEAAAAEVAAAEAAAAEVAAAEAAAAEAAAAEAAAAEAAAAEAAAAEAAAAETAATEAAAAEGAAAEGAAAEGAAAESAAAEGLSEAQLEEAFNYANTEAKLEHIFGQARHGLDALVQSAGGRSGAMRALVNSLADGAGLPEAGRFVVSRVIDGAVVTIRGAVIDGIPKIGTAFIVP